MKDLNKNITIPVSVKELKISLRTANEGDLPDLRQWKNEQREFFFFKDEISPEQQLEWYRAYRKRPEDYMFIVILEEIAMGCMGIRLIDDVWDVYNVILGLANHGGKGLMSGAFQAMLRFAASRRPNPITLRVLKHNPAVCWYQKNGFLITAEQPDHFCMSYQSAKITQDTP